MRSGTIVTPSPHPCMGLLLSSILFERRTFLSPRPYFWLVSLFDPLAVSSSRPAIGSVTPRADAVKDGRHWAVSQCSAVARPLLDGVEHGVTLRGSGRCPTTRRSESSLPVVAPSRHNLVFGGSSKTSSSRIRTMMQPCASAARLLEDGPILSRGMKAMGGGGSPPTRIVLALLRVEASERRTFRTLCQLLCCFSKLVISPPAAWRPPALRRFSRSATAQSATYEPTPRSWFCGQPVRRPPSAPDTTASRDCPSGT